MAFVNDELKPLLNSGISAQVNRILNKGLPVTHHWTIQNSMTEKPSQTQQIRVNGSLKLTKIPNAVTAKIIIPTKEGVSQISVQI